MKTYFISFLLGDGSYGNAEWTLTKSWAAGTKEKIQKELERDHGLERPIILFFHEINL